jgi:hypothetical protein
MIISVKSENFDFSPVQIALNAAVSLSHFCVSLTARFFNMVFSVVSNIYIESNKRDILKYDLQLVA